MAIRLSGMISGLDTDSIVKALMTAQTSKKTKIEANKQKLEWKKEMWSDMNSKVYNFYKSSLSKVRLQSMYKTKNAASSDSSKVTATVGVNATEGTYRIKVNSVASAQYVTSGVVKGPDNGNGGNSKVTGSTKLVDLSTNGTENFNDWIGRSDGARMQLDIATGSGSSQKHTYLLVDENTTVSDYVSALQSAGLNASFDDTQQRFFISSSKSGKDQVFSIHGNKLSGDFMNSMQGLKDAVGYDYLSSTNKKAVTKILDSIQNGTKTYDDVKGSLAKYITTSQKAATTAHYRGEFTNILKGEYLTNDESTPTTEGEALLASESGKTVEQLAAMSAEDKVTLISSLISTKVNKLLSVNDVKSAIEADSTAGAMGSHNFTIDGKTYLIGAADVDSFAAKSYSDKLAALDDAGAAFETALAVSGAVTGGYDTALGAVGINETGVTGDAVGEDDADNTYKMSVVKASDASISFNGATLTSSTSTLNVNGLTLNILAETEEGKELTVTVSKDTSAVYDAIKDFISEYNSVLKTMNTSYNAASANGYSVLTDEQKEDMSDDEVEKWEAKIKSSLLRRDDTLDSLISSFRNNMIASYTASNGKKYSLASLGISTSTDYTEKGLLHIKGDEDDEVYGDQTNILQNMLNKDPDLVMEIMTGLTSNLYKDLTKKMSSSKYSSALTFYNDKQMTTQINQYKKDISKWETKLAELEEKYYSQFTAMEKALANSQSQSSSLSGFFG